MTVAFFGPTTSNHKTVTVSSKEIAVRPDLRAPQGAANHLGVLESKFVQFWDLMETIQVHGYVRAAMSAIGRSVVGTWWNLSTHGHYGDKATKRQKNKLMNFYLRPEREWDNIKDFYSLAHNFMIAAMYLKFFGQAAFYIVRNKAGQPIGLDFLPGFTYPNVDDNGYFKEDKPAFIQFPVNDRSIRVEFESPREIVYITNPDWTGYPTGASDVEALARYSLPLDIYLLTAAREFLRNRSRPDAMYVLPADISEEAFQAFVAQIEKRYTGAHNVGRAPIAVAGDLTVHEFSKLADTLPYQEGRADTKAEIKAVTGTSGAKLGEEANSNANMRESRREFHETTMLPLFRFVELALWEQVHVREFGILGWELAFNAPDFLTAVERATVHMRYSKMGVYSPNDIREKLDEPPRPDELGDMYADEKEDFEIEEPQGSPPEGREDDPGAPGNTGEPTLDDQDPPRGDNHDDIPDRGLIVNELRQWRRFHVKRLKNHKPIREFVSDHIPANLGQIVSDQLAGINDAGSAASIFDEVIAFLDNME